MSPYSFNVLIACDANFDASLFEKNYLTYDKNNLIKSVFSKEELIDSLKNEEFDILICDYDSFTMDFLEILNILGRLKIFIPLIVIASIIPEEKIVSLMKSGVDNIVFKKDIKNLKNIIASEIKKFSVKSGKIKKFCEALFRDSDNEEDSGIKIRSSDVDRDIFDLTEIKERMKINERYYTVLIDDIPALICRFNPDGVITYANDAYCAYFNKNRKELIGSTFTQLIPEDDKDFVNKQFSSIAYENPVAVYRHRVIFQDGSIHWQKWIDRAFFDESKNIIEFQSIGQDITDEIEREQKLKKSIKEKDALLKEIHHRVKNNLQIVISMMEMSKKYINIENFNYIYDDIKNRINSMALIHEQLYRLDNLSEINYGEYLVKLVRNVSCYYLNNRKNIGVEFEVDDIFITIDIAVTCGLIANELITNVYKHAFPNADTGNVRITLSRKNENRYLLSVKDNGVGIPNGVDLKKSYGFMLINLLVNQIDGEIKIKNDGGTEVQVLFSDYENIKRLEA
ncbi:MAG TPA: histidine kinase dimerization/phosphoacceptor domain -containing protein [Spirochaetota bacterium]|mgnify:CR=1 FL=1|nr:histidine kinase dimerization/phosphoacceptor domain -containing protein [Spirochaetota bacterium]